MKDPEHIYLPAQKCVEHLSGWVRLKDRGTVRVVFAPKLGKWVSSWDGREMVGTNQNI